MAAICLVLGLVLGYLFRGSQTQPAPVQAAVASAPPESASATATTATAAPTAMGGGAHPMPTLDQMKQMADKKAGPLLAKLKSDPNNEEVLVQVAKIYEATHQFPEAASYFQKASQVNPKDNNVRIQLASCLFYTGDNDGAIAQLQNVLQNNPKDLNSLFNLGFIEWKGKNDGPGAVATWRQLLKFHPEMEQAKKEQVQRLIAEASQPKAAQQP
jgi:cytochrome c-type biogenesis protein CcmH/NrfG